MRRLGTAVLALMAASCANYNHLPDTPWFDVQLGPALEFQQLEAGADENSGPQVAAEFLLGYEVDLVGTTATHLDAGFQFGQLGTGGDLDGDLYRVLGGVRKTWHVDRVLRPTACFGAAWSLYDPDGFSNAFEIRGPGLYAGGGYEYLISPRWGVNTELRAYVHHLKSDGRDEWNSSLQWVSHLLYRF